MAKLLQQYEHDGVAVTFDARRCIHAAECVRRLPAVFDPGARPWVRLERAAVDEVVEAVLRCPTGALRVTVQGEAREVAAASTEVRTAKHGPLVVRGPVRVVREDGSEVVSDTRVALCRCGQSRRQPLCDGSHRAAGFRDPAG